MRLRLRLGLAETGWARERVQTQQGLAGWLAGWLAALRGEQCKRGLAEEGIPAASQEAARRQSGFYRSLSSLYYRTAWVAGIKEGLGSWAEAVRDGYSTGRAWDARAAAAGRRSDDRQSRRCGRRAHTPGWLAAGRSGLFFPSLFFFSLSSRRRGARALAKGAAHTRGSR